MGIGSGFVYDGFAVTSIDYRKAPTPERPNRITFAEYTWGNEDKAGFSDDELKKYNEEYEDAATFLKNVKFVSGKDKNGKRLFEADKLTIEEAHKEFKVKYGDDVKPLFALHGFNNEPGVTLDVCSDAQESFDEGGRKTAIIPVIWPCYGGFWNYGKDKRRNVPVVAKEMGMLLKDTLAIANTFKDKNLLCHSMGNRVFRMVANTKVKFDNIFLVAADIRHDIFLKKYIDRADNEDSQEMQGLRIFRMLNTDAEGNPKGKIYCLYNGYDYALGCSSYVGCNWLNRLGQVGIGAYDSWIPCKWRFNERLIHPDIIGHTENFNVSPHLPCCCGKAHGYQWMKFAIDFYKSKIEQRSKTE
jgi:hypothetical protein